MNRVKYRRIGSGLTERLIEKEMKKKRYALPAQNPSLSTAFYDPLPTCGHKIKDKNVELSKGRASRNQSKYLGLSILVLAEFMGLRQSIFMSYVLK